MTSETQNRVHEKLRTIIDNLLQTTESLSIYTEVRGESTLKNLEQLKLDSLVVKKSASSIIHECNSILTELGRLKQSVITSDLVEINKKHLEYQKDVRTATTDTKQILETFLKEVEDLSRELKQCQYCTGFLI